MPNIGSTLKRMRQSAKRRLQNRSVKTTIATYRRTYLAAVESRDKDKATTAFSAYCSVLDKYAKKGIIARNTADRKKQRAARLLAAMAKTSSVAETAPAEPAAQT